MVPNSKKFGIQCVHSAMGAKIVARVVSPPEHNKANKELLKKLKNKYRLKARIVRGATSREKEVEFELPEEEVILRLCGDGRDWSNAQD